MSAVPSDDRPIVAHVLFRFDVGGLENGVVNLINWLPEAKWRHAIVALDDIAPSFQRRVRRADVTYLTLRKSPGHLLRYYPTLVRMFRSLRPAIIHTRNLAALEASIPAWIAGVRARIHGEHGWDVQDLDGGSTRFRKVRRIYRPFVRQYIALSDQIAAYLVNSIGISPGAVTRIYNGVDTRRFAPAIDPSRRSPLPFAGNDPLIVGTVGRMQAVKDQVSLVRAAAELMKQSEEARRRLRLVVVGDGPARPIVDVEARSLGISDKVWLPGARDDIPALMQAMDVFCLPSLSEGISNTILEAMSTGLPVIATHVGGNAELVADDISGQLVPPSDPAALAAALRRYVDAPSLIARHGAAGRQRVERSFSIQSMVAAYDALYTDALRVGRPSTVLAHGQD